MYKKGIVFGVFDGLHGGHRYFLSQAARACEELTVVIARDEAARALKGRAPHIPLEGRIRAVTSSYPHFTVVAGDEVSGSWAVLALHAHDIAILGYDQKAIAEELHARAIPYIYAEAYEPHRLKSSILKQTHMKPESSKEG
ncbi:adenylyltransferase/cytidyltransferase family protein [Candidatus Kaiserbacteria bacterium]|nr:adenylyltransferase/cytidyltransferase family protein [Candidatus Kaiserbacteria bacterium]